jgi:hypothetical protein
MRLAYVSILALAAVGAVPALAQTSSGQTTATPAMSTQQSQTVSVDQIKDQLDKAGVKDREEFKGKLVRAQSPEGQPILMVIGPENMEGDKSIDFSPDNVRGKLTQAGFKNIEFIDNSKLVRGKMGDDKAILALAGEQGWRGSAGPAQSTTPDRKRLTDQLEKVGLKNTAEFKGKLMRAQSSDGQTMLVLIGPEDFKGDKSADFSATDLTKFQQGGFKSAEVVQDATLVRGKMDDWMVIALTGKAITEPVSTGSTAGSSQTPKQ